MIEKSPFVTRFNKAMTGRDPHSLSDLISKSFRRHGWSSSDQAEALLHLSEFEGKDFFSRLGCAIENRNPEQVSFLLNQALHSHGWWSRDRNEVLRLLEASLQIGDRPSVVRSAVAEDRPTAGHLG
ncbi:MAG: hypothetical protein WDA20_05135 [Desulfuromonadales bacterium]